ETRARLEERWGALPPTIVSTSRTDGSGILLYRVPSRATWHDPGAGIQIVHHGWRYAVVAPSIHPDTGRPYGWWDQPGERWLALGDVPGPAVDVWLPRPWVDGLSSDRTYDGAGQVTREEALAQLDTFPAGEPCEHVAKVLQDAIASLFGGRHPAVTSGTMKLVNAGCWGHRGVKEAILALRNEFAVAVGSDDD
ncbi:MAG: hypothetical protein GEV09_27675, partial [Pseudonocardiaceae bacterium]|nr:hypothetical protein [Pseudonocardiaceae bacterium]